ncbi:MAG: CFI-box-CTERM domain-containing protein [Candidatus Nanohaloarchaea archaeon]
MNQVPGPYEDTTCQMVAAYGRRDHPHLETVRRFRDEILTSVPFGEKLVEFYYTTAPYFISFTSWNRVTEKITLYGFAYPSYLVFRFSLRLLR